MSMPLTLSEFIKKYTGTKCGNTDANFGECVGLAMLWVENLSLNHIWGNAKDIYSNASTKEYKKIKNSPNVYPQDGDIITWDSSWGGGYGHIAIVKSSNKSEDSFTVFEQNNPLGNPPRVHKYTNWNGVQGWLHPLILDVTPETELQDKINSLEKALKEMTDEKDKYKERSKDYEQDIKDLKKEIEEKDKQYDKAKELIELVSEQKQTAINSANEYSRELLITKGKLKDALESILRLQGTINELQSVEGTEYTFSQIKEIVINFIKRKLNG